MAAKLLLSKSGSARGISLHVEKAGRTDPKDEYSESGKRMESRGGEAKSPTVADQGWLQAAPGRGQAFTQLQPGVSPGEPAFIFKARGASVGVSMVSGLCPMNTKQQHCTVDQWQCRQ